MKLLLIFWLLFMPLMSGGKEETGNGGIEILPNQKPVATEYKIVPTEHGFEFHRYDSNAEWILILVERESRET